MSQFRNVKNASVREALQRLDDRIEQAREWSTDGTLVVESTDTGAFACVPGDGRILAMILGSSGSDPVLYAWQSTQYGSAFDFDPSETPQQGSYNFRPAFERNNFPVPSGANVVMYPAWFDGTGGYEQEYVFDFGEGTGGGSAESGSGPVGGWTMLYSVGSTNTPPDPGSIYFGYPPSFIEDIDFASIPYIDRYGLDETAVLQQLGSGDQIKFFVENDFENVYGFYKIIQVVQQVNYAALGLLYLGGAGNDTFDVGDLVDWGWEHWGSGPPGPMGSQGPSGMPGSQGPAGGGLIVGTESMTTLYPNVSTLDFNTNSFTLTQTVIGPPSTILVNGKTATDGNAANIKYVQIDGTNSTGTSGIPPNSDHVHTLAPVTSAATPSAVVGTDVLLGYTAADMENVAIPIADIDLSRSNGEDDFTVDYNITAINGTFVDSGIDVILPAAGTYLLYAVVVSDLLVTISTGSPKAVIRAKFYDSTASADVPDSLATVNCVDVLSLDSILSGTLTSIYIATGANTVKLYVARDLGTTYTTSKICGNATDGYTRIGYVRLA